ncbi:hypothetical protein [Pseudomonas guariconensis]|uniref:hypothetical protein n=1 Tax=Pseudomonas guariconensis TaxID=1288410 RepID=UPI0018A9BE3E|nr:hypothetical protein [Pseudomonas guariconensis]MBF8722337.1 hypothetical protein [Pseudomonas guariconensis]
MNQEQKAKLTWRLWGGLDAFHIVSYIVYSVSRGRLPFFTDIRLALETLEVYGEGARVFMAASAVLELSIFLSCYLFVTQRRAARWLGFMQTPFRLLLMVPSVSLLPGVLGLFPGNSAVFAIMLVIVSEVLKCWSLWRFSGSRMRH